MIHYLESNYQAIITILAFVVSCVAIWLTYRSLKMQQIHNAKSMLPIHSFNCLNYENAIGVELENRGAGPLIIDSFKVVDTTNSNRSDSNIVDLMPELRGDMRWRTYKRGLEGQTLQPDKLMRLILLESEETDQFIENRSIVREHLSNLEIMLVYRDVYDNMFTANQSLSSFAEEDEEESY